MIPFLHDRLQKLQHLLERSSATLVKYNHLDLDLAAALTACLDEAIGAYRALDRTDVENKLLALKAQYVTAQHGVHPFRLEPVLNQRRAMQRTIALHVLQESAQQVRSDCLHDQQMLSQGRVDLGPIVLHAFSKGLIEVPQDGSWDQKRLEELWHRLLREPETQLAARQLATKLNSLDILLLLEELVALVLAPSG
ncbi:MAG: hypothetical protein EXS08_02030 [Planctomycetes bacterium]|nr:hypothetical protein [Planctomycetota bacterium]